jgi:hypothetical protein
VPDLSGRDEPGPAVADPARCGQRRASSRVSLDVDPNEDATILKKYAAKNKFDWYIAVRPSRSAGSSKTNYDQGFLNPPLQPMLFIDKTGGVYGLPFGIKSAISIQKTLALSDPVARWTSR